ncbi:MAG: formylglycine-generating enzyme family protein [Desulforhabdus sp.]|nr:formylglycine-generating enzyme family protein [Desulforhabdus sp.]
MARTKPKQESIFSTLKELEIDPPTENRQKDPLPPQQFFADEHPALAENHSEVAEAVEAPATMASVDAPGPLDLQFVFISPVTFKAGSPPFEPGRNEDELQHEATLTRGFYMQTTLVTQRLWKAVMGQNPSSFLEGEGIEECPAESVSWYECQNFIRSLNGMDGFSYRLPTEAEWECACRAGALTPFSSGEITEMYCRLDSCLDTVAWYCGNSARKTHPVARKSPNAWGLFDMHGNLCEWCHDWYGEYPSGSQLDPVGPDIGPGRVVRGGSWFSNAKNCRSACRFYWPPNSRSDFIGFRLVRDP